MAYMRISDALHKLHELRQQQHGLQRLDSPTVGSALLLLSRNNSGVHTTDVKPLSY
jgi:hypothetical protein